MDDGFAWRPVLRLCRNNHMSPIHTTTRKASMPWRYLIVSMLLLSCAGQGLRISGASFGRQYIVSVNNVSDANGPSVSVAIYASVTSAIGHVTNGFDNNVGER